MLLLARHQGTEAGDGLGEPPAVASGAAKIKGWSTSSPSSAAAGSGSPRQSSAVNCLVKLKLSPARLRGILRGASATTSASVRAQVDLVLPLGGLKTGQRGGRPSDSDDSAGRTLPALPPDEGLGQGSGRVQLVSARAEFAGASVHGTPRGAKTTAGAVLSCAAVPTMGGAAGSEVDTAIRWMLDLPVPGAGADADASPKGSSLEVRIMATATLERTAAGASSGPAQGSGRPIPLEVVVGLFAGGEAERDLEASSSSVIRAKGKSSTDKAGPRNISVREVGHWHGAT